MPRSHARLISDAPCTRPKHTRGSEAPAAADGAPRVVVFGAGSTADLYGGLSDDWGEGEPDKFDSKNAS